MRTWTPFGDLNALLHDFVASAQRILGADFVGAYLQGSFAVGDADEHSDVDFIVVVEGDPTDAQERELQAMHQRLYASETPWAQHLEGSYVPRDVLRRVDPECRSLLYLDNGATELTHDSHCNTAVVRWSLREHGVTLAGPDPRELVDEVTPAQLRDEVRRVALPEWNAWLRISQERFEDACGGPPAYSRWRQPYTVLTYCRLLQTLESGAVVSKMEAGEWALQTLDPTWRSLIQQALNDRPDPWGRVHQPASREDIDRTLEFADYAARKAATLGA